MNRPKILWNLFHPEFDKSLGNRTLFEAVQGVEGLTPNMLYTEYPDGKIDVEREQSLLREHDLIVFQHPFYWYSSPALFKEWQDKVLQFGFAYPPSSGKALHGKHWLSVITTGGPGHSYRSGGYNNFSMSELLRPLQQTANLCGMKWVVPFVVHGVLPSMVEKQQSTDPESLHARAGALAEFIGNYDLDEIHGIEPLTTRQFLSV